MKFKLKGRKPLAYLLPRLELVVVHLLEALVFNGADLGDKAWANPTNQREDFLDKDLGNMIAEKG